jgi:hypothetical protein
VEVDAVVVEYCGEVYAYVVVKLAILSTCVP